MGPRPAKLASKEPQLPPSQCGSTVLADSSEPLVSWVIAPAC
jgi:hypothetical protein